MKGGRLARWTRSLSRDLGLAMAIVSGLAAHAQAPPGQIINRPPPMPTDPASSGDYDPSAMEQRLNALNIERQKEMVSEANKLLKLARELNEEIAANPSTTLTNDQLHKLAEIEKLARGVKQKMADGVGPTGPSMQLPVVLPPR